MSQNVRTTNLPHEFVPVSGEFQTLAVSTTAVALTAATFATCTHIRIQMTAGDVIRQAFTGTTPTASVGEYRTLGDNVQLFQKSVALGMKWIRGASTDGAITAVGVIQGA